jgi:hypothetical protein
MVSYVGGRVYLTSTSLTGMGVFTPLYFLVSLEKVSRDFRFLWKDILTKKIMLKIDSLS